MENSEDDNITERYSFEIGPIRPPNEGGERSLLIRPTRNCSWNRCAFCPFYNGKKFQIREAKEMKREIDTIEKIRDMLIKNSVEINKVPVHCRSVVSRWKKNGERTAFLQDSNSIIMPTDQLVEILDYLMKTFPSLQRITSYARSDTIAKKDLGELKKIRDAGLSRLHIGLESGNDKILDLVNKGVTAEKHIEGGIKAKEAGFEVSEYVMPGLGGKNLSEKHALHTAKSLNQIDPDYIRIRPLSVYPNTELDKKIGNGEFELNSPNERLKEIKIMIDELEVSSNICFDHSWNSWRDKDENLLFDMDYEGYKLPERREEILELVEEGLKVE